MGEKITRRYPVELTHTWDIDSEDRGSWGLEVGGARVDFSASDDIKSPGDALIALLHAYAKEA